MISKGKCDAKCEMGMLVVTVAIKRQCHKDHRIQKFRIPHSTFRIAKVSASNSIRNFLRSMPPP